MLQAVSHWNTLPMLGFVLFVPSVMRLWVVLCWQQSHSPGLLLYLSPYTFIYSWAAPIFVPYTFIYSLHLSLAMWLFQLFRGSYATTCSYWQTKLAKCFSKAWGWLTGKKTTKHKAYCALHHPWAMKHSIRSFCKAGSMLKSTQQLCQPWEFWMAKENTYAVLLVSYYHSV